MFRRPGVALGRRTGFRGIGGGRRVGVFQSVSGLVLDLNPSKDTTLSGSDLTSWDDQASGLTFSEGTAPLFQASDSQFNDKPTVRFASASSEFLVDGDNLDLGTDHALWFIVSRAVSDQSIGSMIDKRGKGGLGAQAGWRIMATRSVSDPRIRAIIDDGGGNVADHTHTGSLGTTPHVHEVLWDPSTGTVSTFDDGTAGGSNTNASVGSISTTRNIMVGAAPGDDPGVDEDHFWDGECARILMYKRSTAFTAAERSKIRAELGSLYGISVS